MKLEDMLHTTFGDPELGVVLGIPNIEKVVGVTLTVVHNAQPIMTVDYLGEDELRVFTLDEDLKLQLNDALGLGGYLAFTLNIHADRLTTIEVLREARVGQMEKIKGLLKKQTPKELL